MLCAWALGWSKSEIPTAVREAVRSFGHRWSPKMVVLRTQRAEVFMCDFGWVEYAAVTLSGAGLLACMHWSTLV